MKTDPNEAINENEFNGTAGLTKREQFAAMAMQGLIAQSRGSAITSPLDEGAEYSVRVADALIEALNK